MNNLNVYYIVLLVWFLNTGYITFVLKYDMLFFLEPWLFSLKNEKIHMSNSKIFEK